MEEKGEASRREGSWAEEVKSITEYWSEVFDLLTETKLYALSFEMWEAVLKVAAWCAPFWNLGAGNEVTSCRLDFGEIGPSDAVRCGIVAQHTVLILSLFYIFEGS